MPIGANMLRQFTLIAFFLLHFQAFALAGVMLNPVQAIGDNPADARSVAQWMAPSQDQDDQQSQWRQSVDDDGCTACNSSPLSFYSNSALPNDASLSFAVEFRWLSSISNSLLPPPVCLGTLLRPV